MAGSIPALLTAEPAASLKASQLAARKRVSPGREAWRRFGRHRLAVASAVILGLIIATVVLGPLFWRVPINDIDFAATSGGAFLAASVRNG